MLLDDKIVNEFINKLRMNAVIRDRRNKPSVKVNSINYVLFHIYADKETASKMATHLRSSQNLVYEDFTTNATVKKVKAKNVGLGQPSGYAVYIKPGPFAWGKVIYHNKLPYQIHQLHNNKSELEVYEKDYLSREKEFNYSAVIIPIKNWWALYVRTEPREIAEVAEKRKLEIRIYGELLKKAIF